MSTFVGSPHELPLARWIWNKQTTHISSPGSLWTCPQREKIFLSLSLRSHVVLPPSNSVGWDSCKDAPQFRSWRPKSSTYQRNVTTTQYRGTGQGGVGQRPMHSRWDRPSSASIPNIPCRKLSASWSLYIILSKLLWKSLQSHPTEDGRVRVMNIQLSQVISPVSRGPRKSPRGIWSWNHLYEPTHLMPTIEAAAWHGDGLWEY